MGAQSRSMVARSRIWKLFSGGFHRVVFVSLWLSVCQVAALAQGSDAGKIYLDRKEMEVKWLAGNASLNQGSCGGLDGCSAACSRVRCMPVSGEELQCAPVDNNQFFSMCSSGACPDKTKLDYRRSFVVLPAPASTQLSTEVARDICLQRMLDPTFQTLSVPSSYNELFFGSTSGAFRQFPGRENNEMQCKTFDPRWRPWYLNGISVSRDLKILVDVGNGMGNPVTPGYNPAVGTTYLDVAKSLALGLLQTVSPGDNVEVMSFNSVSVTSLGGAFAVNSTYDYLNTNGHTELATLVTNVKNLAGPPLTGASSDLNGAILKAASSFNQLKSLKVIIVLSNGLFVVNSTTFPSAALQNNKAKLMVYKLPTNDDGGDTFLLNTSFRRDICSVQGSFESLDAPATLNPLYSMRSYFTYLAGIQLSAVGGNVTWSNAYASVSQGLKAITPTYPAFGSDGLLIGVAGSDVVIDKLDDPLKALVLQEFSRRNQGTLPAPANIPMTCSYQNSSANLVCSGSTPPSSSAICPKTDTSSTLADLTCCSTCGSSEVPKKSVLKAWIIAVISIAGALIIAAALFCSYKYVKNRDLKKIPPFQGS